MSKLIKHTDKNYTVISNGIFHDSELSLKAKGLLCQMLSLPDNWEYSVEGLIKLTSDGKGSVTAAIKELEDHKYLIRKQIKEKGKFGQSDYLVSDRPMTEKPMTEKPMTEKPMTENQPQLNTNKSNTKELNTKELNRYSPSGKREVYDEVIDFLNWKCGTNYKSCSRKTRSLIDARLNDGFKLEDFKTVITKKSADWLGDERMRKYLRPETLFGTKFESYLNQPYNRNQDKSFYERLSEITNRMEKGQL